MCFMTMFFIYYHDPVGAVKLLGKACAFLPVHRHELMELRDLFVFDL